MPIEKMLIYCLMLFFFIKVSRQNNLTSYKKNFQGFCLGIYRNTFLNFVSTTESYRTKIGEKTFATSIYQKY